MAWSVKKVSHSDRKDADRCERVVLKDRLLCGRQSFFVWSVGTGREAVVHAARGVWYDRKTNTERKAVHRCLAQD